MPIRRQAFCRCGSLSGCTVNHDLLLLSRCSAVCLCCVVNFCVQVSVCAYMRVCVCMTGSHHAALAQRHNVWQRVPQRSRLLFWAVFFFVLFCIFPIMHQKSSSPLSKIDVFYVPALFTAVLRSAVMCGSNNTRQGCCTTGALRRGA